jgi:hypothetical protein
MASRYHRLHTVAGVPRNHYRGVLNRLIEVFSTSSADFSSPSTVLEDGLMGEGVSGV